LLAVPWNPSLSRHSSREGSSSSVDDADVQLELVLPEHGEPVFDDVSDSVCFWILVIWSQP
jgi:uncharacterized protein YgfB (UPF0149 family)